MADNPKNSYRAISGLILALFVTSAAVGTIATMLDDHGSASSGTAASDSVVDQFNFNQSNSSVPSIPSAVLDRLQVITGVKAVTLVYTAPSDTRTDGPVPDINGLGGTLLPAVVSCKELAQTPALGRCHTGASYASVGFDLGFMPVTKSVTLAANTTWPTATLPDGLHGLSVQLAAVMTNGSTASIERAETVLDSAFPFASSVGLFGQINPQDAQLLTELQTASDVVIAASLLMAGCSLAISMAAGIGDRRRPFSLLRLAGAPIGVLRRVVCFEAAAPLAVIALGAAVIGLGAADLFLRSQLGISLRVPDADYFAIVFGGLLGSFAIIAATLPMIDRVAGLYVARNE